MIVQNSHTVYSQFVYEFFHEFLYCEDLCTKSEQKKKFVCKISEILNKERNLCTNLNKPTRLDQDRHSKTLSFDNYMVSLKNKFIKRLY